jgi:hypothetical protein
MRILAVAITCLTISFVSANAYARQTDLVEPEAVAIPAGQATADTLNAIKFALAKKNWVIENTLPNHVEASHSQGGHSARIAVDSTATQVSIRYVDSVNLNFEQDGNQREIHPTYNKWVADLRSELASDVSNGVPADAVLPQVTGQRTSNPPPSEKFSNFNRFELADATLASGYAGQEVNEDALRNIRFALTNKLGPVLAQWNAAAPAKARVLRIEPIVEEIRFIGTAARIFVGALAGRSNVTVKVRYIDVATGTVIANPELFERSDRATGFTVSARDYKMLENIGAAVTKYTQENYANAVGGGNTSAVAN